MADNVEYQSVFNGKTFDNTIAKLNNIIICGNVPIEINTADWKSPDGEESKDYKYKIVVTLSGYFDVGKTPKIVFRDNNGFFFNMLTCKIKYIKHQLTATIYSNIQIAGNLLMYSTEWAFPSLSFLMSANRNMEE